MSINKRSKKRSSKKKYIKKGGRFLGKGLHGCVYGKWKDQFALYKISPQCFSKDYRNNGLKILDSHKNLIEEWKSTQMLRELIPSYQNWYYIPEKMCQINKMHPEDTVVIDSKSAESKCHFNINKNTALVLPIADLPGNEQINEKVETLLIAFKNLFEGIYILGKKKIVHNDLKEKNVVYSIKHKKFYIIDFGHMRTFQQEGWRDASLEDILKYHAWPFDWFFGTFLLKNIKDNSFRNIRFNYKISDLLLSTNTNFNELWKLFVKKFENSKSDSLVMRGLNINNQTLNIWYNIVSQNDLKLTLEEYISLSTEKLDVWAIAKCCSTIIEKNYPNSNNILILKFNNLMKSFLNPSVLKRPTSTQALDLYNIFLIDNKLI